MTIAQFLKEERLKRGLKQDQMAALLECSLSHYKEVEQGKANAGVALQYRIAKLTRKSPTFIYKLRKEEENKKGEQ